MWRAGDLSIYKAAHEAPEAEAVILGPRVIRIQELAAAVAETHQQIRSDQLHPGDRVAIVARPDWSSLVVVSAAIEEGLVPCLLHPRMPESTRQRLKVQVGVKTELPTHLAPSRPSFEARTFTPRAMMSSLTRAPGDDCVIVFTSGSSGQAKGVRLSRRALVASALGSEANLGWQPKDRWGLNLPVAHVGGFSILTRTRLARKAMVLSEPDSKAGFDPQGFVDWICARQMTLVSLVPTMLYRLVEAGLRAPPSIRGVLVGGAAVSSYVLAQARELGWPALTTYGLTEAASQVTTQPLSEAFASLDMKPVDQGFPLEGRELRIESKSGRVCLRGPGLFSGYTHETPEAWDQDGWFLTEDIGELDDQGRFVLKGRLHELIISGGENVSPTQVEGVLTAHAAIGDAVVFGHPDPEWGEVVWAAVALRDQGQEVLANLSEYLRRTLAPYERPRRIWILDSMPTLENGKVDRRKAQLVAESLEKTELRTKVD